MKAISRFLLCSLSLASLLFVGCQTMSDDPAPGGIQASDTGMNVQKMKQWQDRTTRSLAY